MSVITQNPILLTGSLRMNLDPFEEYADQELWDALDEASITIVSWFSKMDYFSNQDDKQEILL